MDIKKKMDEFYRLTIELTEAMAKHEISSEKKVEIVSLGSHAFAQFVTVNVLGHTNPDAQNVIRDKVDTAALIAHAQLIDVCRTTLAHNNYPDAWADQPEKPHNQQVYEDILKEMDDDGKKH